MRLIMASDLKSRDRRWITYSNSGTYVSIQAHLPTVELADYWNPYYTGEPIPPCPVSGYIYEPR